jgi:hypothetical protein
MDIDSYDIGVMKCDVHRRGGGVRLSQWYRYIFPLSRYIHFIKAVDNSIDTVLSFTICNSQRNRRNSYSYQCVCQNLVYATSLLSGKVQWFIYLFVLIANGFLLIGIGITIRHNTQIHVSQKIANHIIQNYTNNEGHTTHNEYIVLTINTITANYN